MFSMHTEHLANISKSVTKNATFPRTGGLPCLITQQLHVCCISYSFGGLIFCISATPHLGTSIPLFHDTKIQIEVTFLTRPHGLNAAIHNFTS